MPSPEATSSPEVTLNVSGIGPIVADKFYRVKATSCQQPFTLNIEGYAVYATLNTWRDEHDSWHKLHKKIPCTMIASAQEITFA